MAVWTEPRFPVGPTLASGPTLSLVALAEALELAGIELDFAATGSGWLRFTWPATLADWPFQLTERVDRLCDDLGDELADQAATAAEAGNGDVPLCGLFGLYDWRIWRVPAPDPDQPITARVERFGKLLEAVLDAQPLSDFLAGETAPPPAFPTTVGERLVAGATEEEAAANLGDLDLFADELVRQIPAAALGTPPLLRFAESAHRWFPDLSATQVLLYAQEMGVLDSLTSIGEQAAAEFQPVARYGDYDLRRDDTDAGHVYDGQARPTAPGDVVPAAGQPGFVAQLRRDLNELGFGPMFKYLATEGLSQAFDLNLEWAVRELQLYARMPNLAHQVVAGGAFYADRLEQVANPAPYAGPVCGVVNAATAS